MAAKWQRWMPFHIDRFRGSPEVQAMHPAARIGFLYLLASAWQSDDCTLSADPMDLATASGLGDDLWSTYGARILKKFVLTDGRLRNEVLFAEWSSAKRATERKQDAAKRTNSVRIPHAKRNANRDTLTETYTSTEQKQIPSRDKREPDPRHAEFKSVLNEYWTAKNKIDMPWSPGEAKQLAMLLAANPALDGQAFRELLRNRYLSKVNHAERPRAWIDRVTDYAAGPLNEFNKPQETGHAGAQHSQGKKFDAAHYALSRALSGVEEAVHGGAGEDVPGPRGGDGSNAPRFLLEGTR